MASVSHAETLEEQQSQSSPAGATAGPRRPREGLAVSTIERLRDPMPTDRLNSWLLAAGITLFAFFLRMINVSRPAGLVFDETYYAKDAWSLWHFGFERNWADDANAKILHGDLSGLEDGAAFVVHPPLGKWLIGLGEQLFGFNSFGWRFMPLVFGSLLVLVVFRLARRLSRSTLIGVVAAILLTFDGLAFAMSRIALLDIFQATITVAAVLCLVIDRDWFRNKLADYLEENQLSDLGERFGPGILWRPWRLTAGVLFGLACAVKWNSVYVLAAFAVLSVAWDLGARRLAGAGKKSWETLISEAPLAFLYLVVAALPAYLVTWTGWLVSDQGYDRNWGAENPDALPVKLLGKPLGSLWKYHKDTYDFHTGDFIHQATHTYSAHPAGWLVIARPIGIDAVNDIVPGTDGCPGPDNCLRVISGLGTPVLWWIGVFALVAALVWWIGTRDWRFGVPVVGVASVWLPWFGQTDRPLFFFYAIMIIPFTVTAVALAMGKVLGETDDVNRRRRGAIVCGVFMALVLINFAYIYPLLTDGLLRHSQWLQRMWLKSWI